MTAALALLVAGIPAAALAEKGPAMIYVHPYGGKSNPEGGPMPQVVRPHVYVEPSGLRPEFVEPPAYVPAPIQGPAPRPPKSIAASRFDVTVEATDGRPGGLFNGRPAACDLGCQRSEYLSLGALLAAAAREGFASDGLLRVLVAEMKRIGENVDRLQNETPGQNASEPSFVDDLMEVYGISGEQGREVLGPIIITELISGLFGTQPACGLEKLEDGTPTCVK